MTRWVLYYLLKSKCVFSELVNGMLFSYWWGFCDDYCRQTTRKPHPRTCVLLSTCALNYWISCLCYSEQQRLSCDDESAAVPPLVSDSTICCGHFLNLRSYPLLSLLNEDITFYRCNLRQWNDTGSKYWIKNWVC